MRDIDPLIAILCWYYFETERYDRTLPGAWDHHVPDVWQPAGTHRRLSYQYAREIRDRARAAARELGCSPEEWQWASDRVTRWSFERWGELAKEPTRHLAEPAKGAPQRRRVRGGQIVGDDEIER